MQCLPDLLQVAPVGLQHVASISDHVHVHVENPLSVTIPRQLCHYSQCFPFLLLDLSHKQITFKIGVLALLDDGEEVLGLLGGAAGDGAASEALVPHGHLLDHLLLAGGLPTQGSQQIQKSKASMTRFVLNLKEDSTSSSS